MTEPTIDPSQTVENDGVLPNQFAGVPFEDLPLGQQQKILDAQEAAT